MDNAFSRSPSRKAALHHPSPSFSIGPWNSNDEHRRRNKARSLRDPRSSGRGRDGGGVQGAGHAARTDRGSQGAAATSLVIGRGASALRAAGENDLAALASAYLRALRRGKSGRG